MSYRKSQIKQQIKMKLESHFGVAPDTATLEQFYRAVSMMIQDIMSDQRMAFAERVAKNHGKKAYYLCMEFLLGRSLKNNLYNLEITDECQKALREFNVELQDLYKLEPDAGLGNGGLGRLASCFLDSAASLGYPVTGYSIRYDYGLFRQKIVDGWQTELPDNWLQGGDVWLVQRIDESVKVHFEGTLEEKWVDGRLQVIQNGGHTVIAVPYDIMISGYRNASVSLLRLWSAQSPVFDVALFNRGEYMQAMEESAMSEMISKVLYPSDNNIEGKSLRLRQQYFLVSASIQDIAIKHLSQFDSLNNLPDQVVIHINETHPALVIPELMRIMLDDCGYEWEKAWEVVEKTVAYTNHTVMKEALEVWPESIFKIMLPRIYEIVKEINDRLCKKLFEIFPGGWDRIAQMAIVSYGYIHMSNLCVATCFSINGVSNIHSQIIRNQLFADYAKVFPKKFSNVTNGIAHRRWICQANPKLCSFITELIGPAFQTNAMKLNELKSYMNDNSVLLGLAKIKKANKEQFTEHLNKTAGILLDPTFLFDVQVKRLHEYKRQTLNILHVLYLYLTLKENPQLDMQPRAFLFGAKAAPGYTMAKQIIRLICSVAKEIDEDKAAREKLRVVFLEDYRVSLAELLMPAAEISEQISLAGTEASGTGNMKLMINGAVTIGTLDGANIEMMQAAGNENILIFGLEATEVEKMKSSGYSSTNIYQNNPAIRMVIDKLRTGVGGVQFPEIADSLIGGPNRPGDPYMVLKDFPDYCRIREESLKRYSDPIVWNRMSLCNIASAGIFSADRALTEYAQRIWNIKRW
ncbi:MAG: glycogen/starch/alpha-glucan phosphorylase [Clostridiales bacterium]|nr:glycogen/starch/alpha-glucan phosphorylase [Clostridiales bacterium]